MRTFLLWQPNDPHRPDLAAAAVGARLHRQFAPLFAPEPTRRERAFGNARFAWLELPVGGFKAPFWEERGDRFAFAGEYPLNARRLLRAHGALPADGKVLLALADLLGRDGAAVVREMIPPGLLIAGDARGVVLHNDALGQAQLFEYEDEHVYAVTNRVMALGCLGVRLRPEVADWALKMVAGWFPGDCSGYAGVRCVRGGSRIEFGGERVRHEVRELLGSWVRPEPMASADALELAHKAMHAMLRDAIELWERPSVGLSGGWDSRTVVSCLRALGADFDLRVRGSTTNVDVMIAAELARMAGLPIRIKEGGGLPSDTVAGCRASIHKSLLWQAGNFATLKHKNFLARAGKDTLDGGVVNVMGQHGGIGKADFARKIRAGDHPPERYEDLLLDSLMKDAPLYLRADLFDRVRGALRDAYRAADRHGLTGRGPLHFFFLHEYTRRWGSATVNSQTGLVVAPFLSPDMVRACYALPEADLVAKPVHRHITQRNAPEWAAFPYEDQVTEEDLRSGRIPPIAASTTAPREDLPEWRAQRRRHKFGYRSYWRTMAFPLIEEAFTRGGLWTEVFDADLARKHWLDAKSGGDLIALLHVLPDVVAAAAQ